MIEDRPFIGDVEHTEHPMRIAVVYCRNPLPMRNADQITVAHLIEFLWARGHIVDLYCFENDGRSNENTLSAADLAWLESRCSRIVHVRRGRSRALAGAAVALLGGKPLQVGWFSSRHLARELSHALDTTRYDVLYAYYFRSAETVINAVKRSGPHGQLVPKVLAMQLSQTLNTRRIRDNATNFATRLVFGLESWLVSRYEARIWQKFERTALIGPADVEAIAAQCRSQGLPTIDNWFYSPHGTDIERFRPRTGVTPVPGTVLFAGTLFYPPNIQAAVWLVKAIWPLVRQQIPDAQLNIVGREPTQEVMSLASATEGVDVIGSVPDLSEYMLRSAVCVNPVRAAGGMQNKLIEYLASGRPVVATGIANEGIQAPDTLLELADDAQQFANKIVYLLQNPTAAEEMGMRAREYAQLQWSWEAHYLVLDAKLADLAARRVVEPAGD